MNLMSFFVSEEKSVYFNFRLAFNHGNNYFIEFIKNTGTISTPVPSFSQQLAGKNPFYGQTIYYAVPCFEDLDGYHHCAITAPSMHHHCATIAPSLRHHCTITAPGMGCGMLISVKSPVVWFI